MQWSNVKLIFLREVRDQLRDRRTLFMIAVLPLLLYPLLGMSFFQVSQFLREHPMKVLIVGMPNLEGLPPLADKDHFDEQWLSDRQQSRLYTLQFESPADVSHEMRSDSVEDSIRHKVQEGKFEVAIFFPANFRQELDKLRSGLTNEPDSTNPTTEPPKVPKPKVMFNTANEKSRLAYARVLTVLRNWVEAVGEQNLRESKLPITAARPFEFEREDVAEPQQRSAAMWSKILPFVLLIWALTGAFYPAIDLCAGEKERGTLETLLSSPALRSEIVTGKLLTVMLFSVATSLLNLMSMGITGTLVISHLPMADVAERFGLPPLISFVWLIAALLPVSALFGALCIALASFARSSKEGQYYLMPLVLITLPLVILPMAPGVELNLGNSLIPITGLVLLLRSLLEGNYSIVLPYILPVVGMTLLCCLIAVRWAVDQFNKEGVLFRESERLDLGLWLQHLRRDRGETPSVTEALFCGVVILLIRFFLSFVASVPKTFDEFAAQQIISQIATFVGPALIMAAMLTRSPRQTLSLRMPALWTLPAALLLVVAVHPIAKLLQVTIQYLYPAPLMIPEPLKEILENPPNFWGVLLVMALTPAICEELAFRGFILSGLRHLGHKWRAIVLSSVMFGFTHLILQQSIQTSIIGVLVGYLVVQTGSIFPAMLFHFGNNALMQAIARLYSNPSTREHFVPYTQTLANEDFIYHWWVFGFGVILTGWLLLKFSDLSYRKSDEEALEESIERRTVELNA